MNLHSEAPFGRLHSEDFIRGLQTSEYIYYYNTNNTNEETKLSNKHSNGIVLTIRCQDHLNSPK